MGHGGWGIGGLGDWGANLSEESLADGRTEIVQNSMLTVCVLRGLGRAPRPRPNQSNRPRRMPWRGAWLLGLTRLFSRSSDTHLSLTHSHWRFDLLRFRLLARDGIGLLIDRSVGVMQRMFAFSGGPRQQSRCPGMDEPSFVSLKLSQKWSRDLN